MKHNEIVIKTKLLKSIASQDSMTGEMKNTPPKVDIIMINTCILT